MSGRMELIAGFSEGETVLDVGCDHGYVCRYILNRGGAKKVIAADISEKSLAKARRLLASDPRAEFRLGGGLSVLAADEKVDTIIISGMGGRLTARILREGADRLKGFPRLVLSPQSDVRLVRECIISLGYKLIYDRCHRERSKFYDIMVCAHGKQSGDGDFLDYGISDLLEPSEAFIERLTLTVARLESKITSQNEAVLREKISRIRRILWRE